MPKQGTKQEAAALAAGYTRSHRVYEVLAILATTSATIVFGLRLASCSSLSGWWAPLAVLVGLLFADFVSGFVHWLFDTWGSVDTPIVGALAIRTFRHHHVDEHAIVRHDFVETNGHNFGLALVVASFGLWYVRTSDASLFDVFVGMVAFSAIVFVSLTSQIHKWAHSASPSRVVRLLQKARLLLSPEHHAVHHAAPHTRNYCITVGWLNGPLRTVRFFEVLERAITALTGICPREDDDVAPTSFSSPESRATLAAARSGNSRPNTRSS